MSAVFPWLVVGLATYIGTAALGTSAQLGLVNTRPFRWLHHVLFAAVWLTLAAALWAARLHPSFWALLPIAGCMGILPRVKAGTRPHCTLATIGLGCYVLALILALVWRGL
jgi:hypothetical protein